MNTITTIQTPRGNFNVKAIFNTTKEANEKGFFYYFTNQDGTEIFTQHTSQYSVYFAIKRKKGVCI